MKKIFFTLCALCLCGTMWGLTNDSRYLCDADRPTNESGEIYEDANGSGLSFYISVGSSYVTAGSAVITYVNDADLNTNNPYNDSSWTTGYNLTGVLTIPETVKDSQGNEYPVAHIGAYAFYKTGITGALTIPACINELGRSAFESCTGITSVTLEYSATALQEENGVATANSFYGCSGIETVYLNRDVNDGRGSSASNYAYLDAPFSYLTSIKTIYVGEEVTKIPYNMFNCNGNSSCVLSTVYCYATDHIPSLDFRSFGQHTDLTLYVYDELVESFKDDHQTYTDNYNNSSGGWGDVFSTITGMGEEPDEEQPEGTLRDVTTGLYFEIDSEGVVSIVADASGVYTDSNLVKNNDGSYTLPSSVEDKGGTSGNVTRVGASAFEESSISGHLVIPATITAVGEKAFQNCTALTEVTYEYSATALQDESAGNNAGTECFLGCSGVTTVHLNRDITIGHSGYLCAPFCYMTSITTVYIGEYVTKIPDYMFRNTSTTCLATVYSYASTPPTLGTAPFDNLASEHTLYVNYDDVNTYKADSSWENVFGKANIHSLTGEDPDEPTDENAFQYNGLWYDPIFDENGEETGEAQIIASQDETVYSGTISIPETAVNEATSSSYTVTRINTDAFSGCTGITGEVVIPANIINMGQRAFANCTGITSVTYEYGPSALNEENTTPMADGSFVGCSGVTTVNLYRDINYLAGEGQFGAFRGVTSITTVNIGPRVTYIPAYMFRPASGTNNISTINCYAAVPPTLGTIPFSTLPSVYTINVPQGSVNAYTTSWTDYSNFAELSNAYAVDITLSNDDGYYATYYNSKAVDIYPQGGTESVVTSYAVSGVTVEDEDEGYLDLAEVGATVPAETAVLVEATGGGTYTIIETTAAGSASYTGENDLYGYDTATTVTNDSNYYYYTLSHPSSGGSLGFYWATSDGSATDFISAAHKAYLMLLKSKVETLKSISLRKGDGGGDTTGITSVEVENEANTVKGIYTLQGVRVSNMNQKGVYIVDGKKVLVK